MVAKTAMLQLFVRAERSPVYTKPVSAACTRSSRARGQRSPANRCPNFFRAKTDEIDPPVPSENKPPRTAELPSRVKAILASKGLTLHRVSQIAEKLYGKSSPFFVPHNLYYDLGLETFTPSLHQLFALSRISNYRLADWLWLFGFDLGDLTRLEILLSSKRTVLLDPSLDDPHAAIPWFESKTLEAPQSAVVPLGRLLDSASPRPIALLSEINNRNFVYAKLGLQDAFAFPDLLPGSIVRVNPHDKLGPLSPTNAKISHRFFLIAHSQGLCCCRVQSSSKKTILPISTQLPYAQVELRIPEEVSILGGVDMEIRPLLKLEQPEVPGLLAKHWKPEELSSPETKLGPLLRSARTKRGLSFREASALSRQIAAFLGDEHYFASPGSLSDYETLDMPPRHVHKAITLCAVYGLRWTIFLKSVGLQLEETGTEVIDDPLLGAPVLAKTEVKEETGHPERGFLNALLKPWDMELPLFLRGSLRVLSGLPNLSLHDIFSLDVDRGPALVPVHLNGAFLAIVNRRKKAPVHWKSKPLWQQPLYLLLRRDGTYVCAFCSLENSTLILHSYIHGYHRSERLRNRHDAEVIGQVVTVARGLP
jgi:transcriptional regulator with XRE-family HTH domain